MDSQSKTTTRPSSGIPRLTSRLPLPTSTAAKTIRPSPSRDRLQADPGLDHSRLRRPSHESLRKKPSTRFTSPAKTIGEESESQIESQIEIDETQIPENLSPPGEDVEVAMGVSEARGRSRWDRPSLSERTIETLSNIPPSPASVRRQSSFFNGASPMRSPSRTPSVSSYSRSPSRSSSGQAGNDLYSQPVSKLRLTSRSRMSMSSSTDLASPTSKSGENPSSMRLPSSRQSIAAGGTENNVTPQKTNSSKARQDPSEGHVKPSTVRPSPSKTSLRPSQSNMGPPERPLHVRKTRKTQTESPSKAQPPTATPRATSRYVSSASTQDELNPEQQAESETRKASKSSNTLRETIAKAKAARKTAAAKGDSGKPVPNVQPVDTWNTLDVEDPFNQIPKGSISSVLRKRVEGARTTGTLNIAALSLKEIPQEVLKMYEFDPDAPNWFENVDLVKFIAADNELEEVSDATFPDIDPEDVDPDNDERGPQFGGIEALDLHGNMLQSVPLGLRRLHGLRSLNLSNNALSMEQMNVIMSIPSLVDLKLANNQLKGPLPSDIGRLGHLEALDLRGNALTALPEELVELTCLKTLDVGENQLKSLPFDALSRIPLRTLNAPKNLLEGTLIPSSVTSLEHLQSLNIANNTVEIFAANEKLSLPNIQNLYIPVNRIRQLPCVSSWESLLILSAEDNSLSEIPTGLVELKNVKSIDLTGNDLTRLEDRIGMMPSLSSFKVANNPLRERKLLSMSSDEIIQDLRNRCEPDPQDTDDEGSVATQFTLAPETPTLGGPWRVRPGGVLDRSYSDLTQVEADKIEMINKEDVRCLYLQHNELRCLPLPALAMLSQGLVDLDLSHNPLASDDLLSSSLELPRLQSLILSAAGLTSLDALLTQLQAPSLNLLDVSNNRLKGPLPYIRQTFPQLKTFLASDNQIASLEFEAVQGLQVLDVSNNDIDYLPPKIGLLGAEHSPRNWGNGSALRRFEVAGNRFRVPRWQTVAKGTDAVLEFLKTHIPHHDMPEWERDDAPVDEF